MTAIVGAPGDGAVARRHVLADGWTVRLDSDGPNDLPREAEDLRGVVVPAQVPGAVHDDLFRAGLIPDPMHGDNELAVAWVSRADWVYECDLAVLDLANARWELVFDGLDTVARVELDGRVLGQVRNMHRRYRYDVTDIVRSGAGRHRLAVHFTSAYTEAEVVRSAIGPRPNSYPEPFNFVRTMACSFGWDWGPTLVGAGIWREAALEQWHTACIGGVRVTADVLRDGTDARATGALRVALDVHRDRQVPDNITVQVLLDGNVVGQVPLVDGETAAVIEAEIPDVRVWQPVGYGPPERYRLETRLMAADGTVLDVDRREIGFRAVHLDRSADYAGTRFTVEINGKPVLVRGVNWIPGDLLPGRMTRDRYRTMLEPMVEVGCNLVRVWGGGIYESDEFYDLCDELGLLVWQDFLFACAAYPEEEPLRSEILAEAAQNVARLASHPSLVLWNGNNENQWLRDVEGWRDQPGGDLTWGERYYSQDFPEIVARVDPSRPYTQGSPWSGSAALEPNDPAHQTHHSWDVWNKADYAHYRDSRPRFVSEFGWQAPATWRTLREAVSDQPLTPSSPGVLHHQKATGGMAKLRRGLAPHTPVPDDVDAWHFLTQWNQVRAIETGILHWRSHWPHTAGTILWQWNDVWPALSWSAIDSAGRPKPLFHALREIYADRVVTLQPTGDGLVVCLLNDSDDLWAGELALRRAADAGVNLARRLMPVEVAPRSVLRIDVPAELIAWDDPTDEVLLAQLGDKRGWWFPVEPAESTFVGAPPLVEAAVSDEGLTVTVTATSLLRDFLLQADRLHPDARADRGFVTLLPGESALITVSCPEKLDPAQVNQPWVTAHLTAVVGAERQGRGVVPSA